MTYSHVYMGARQVSLLANIVFNDLQACYNSSDMFASRILVYVCFMSGLYYSKPSK